MPPEISLIIYGATIIGIIALAWKYRHGLRWSFCGDSRTHHLWLTGRAFGQPGPAARCSRSGSI